MLGLDKLFEYYCSANHVTAEQMNKMIICLLAIVVIIQIITAFINISVQFVLKKRDIKTNFVSSTYLATRSIYENIYSKCKDVYRDILTSMNSGDVDNMISIITMYISENEIHLSKKIRLLSDDIVDKLTEFNHNRSNNNISEISKAFAKYKTEFKNHDNY